MVECTGLENRRAARFRGFESLSLRHKFWKVKRAGFPALFHIGKFRIVWGSLGWFRVGAVLSESVRREDRRVRRGEWRHSLRFSALIGERTENPCCVGSCTLRALRNGLTDFRTVRSAFLSRGRLRRAFGTFPSSFALRRIVIVEKLVDGTLPLPRFTAVADKLITLPLWAEQHALLGID